MIKVYLRIRRWGFDPAVSLDSQEVRDLMAFFEIKLSSLRVDKVVTYDDKN
jgi:hypothetical protein